MDIAMIGLIFSVVATVTAGGWVILHSISSQLSALRLELENKIETVDGRLGVGIQKLEDRMDGRMGKLEAGQINLGRQIARLEGMLLHQPSSEEPQPA